MVTCCLAWEADNGGQLAKYLETELNWVELKLKLKLKPKPKLEQYLCNKLDWLHIASLEAIGGLHVRLSSISSWRSSFVLARHFSSKHQEKEAATWTRANSFLLSTTTISEPNKGPQKVAERAKALFSELDTSTRVGKSKDRFIIGLVHLVRFGLVQAWKSGHSVSQLVSHVTNQRLRLKESKEFREISFGKSLITISAAAATTTTTTQLTFRGSRKS